MKMGTFHIHLISRCIHNYAFDNPVRFIDPDGMLTMSMQNDYLEYPDMIFEGADPDDWIKYIDGDGVSQVKWVDEATNQKTAEEWAAKGGKDGNGNNNNSDVKYIGKTGVEYGHDDKGDGTGNYNLNSDGTASLIGKDGMNENVTVTAKSPVTKGDPANAEPANPIDQTATVVGGVGEFVSQGLDRGSKLASSAKNGMETTDEIAQQLGEVAQMSETAGKVLSRTGMVASWVSAGTAAATAYNNPTVGNVTMAILKTGWAGLQTFGKVNPGVAAAVAVVDIIATACNWW